MRMQPSTTTKYAELIDWGERILRYTKDWRLGRPVPGAMIILCEFAMKSGVSRQLDEHPILGEVTPAKCYAAISALATALAEAMERHDALTAAEWLKREDDARKAIDGLRRMDYPVRHKWDMLR